MQLEQAIFTSVRGKQREGYQVAAASPGVGNDLVSELSHWGPAHDSLNQDSIDRGSVNFHPLSGDWVCVSSTRPAGAEYSGRGGERIYTQMFLVGRDDFARFANHPFRLLEAVQAIGQLQVLDKTPEQLKPIALVGRSRAVDRRLLTRVQSELGQEKLQLLVETVRSAEALAVFTPVAPERVFSAMFDLLDVEERAEISFSTGLNASPRRPFRVIALPDDQHVRRRAAKSSEQVLLDLSEDVEAALH